MKKGWNLDDYVNYVKIQLGAPTVSIACEQNIPFIIEKIAFEDLKNYMQTIHTMTCAYSPTIDLTDKKVANIIAKKNDCYRLRFNLEDKENVMNSFNKLIKKEPSKIKKL